MRYGILNAQSEAYVSTEMHRVARLSRRFLEPIIRE